MKKSIPWVAVLALVALLVIAASMPKYVGRFYGDGAGVTNAGLWTNYNNMRWFSADRAPDLANSLTPPLLEWTNGSIWIGKNILQDQSFNANTIRFPNILTMVRSNEPATLGMSLAVLSDENYDYSSQLIYTIIGDSANPEGRYHIDVATESGKAQNFGIDIIPNSITYDMIYLKTNNVKIFAVDSAGVARAYRFDAVGTPGDIRAETTITATNAFRIIPPDNGGTSTANAPSPLGYFGSMMLSGTTNTVTIGSAGTYYTLTNYGTVRTNGFGANKATGFLTNTVAGYYRITVYASMVGGASDTIEGEVFLNETGREEISLFGSYDNPARVRTMSSTGILYIPAMTGISFRLNNRSDTDNITIWRAGITVGTP